MPDGNGQGIQTNLRRYQDRLAISGIAVIAFAVWHTIKPLLYVLYRPEYVGEMLNLPLEKYGEIDYAFYGMLTVFAFDLMIRMYVGFSAAAESRGRRRGWFYVIVAIILVCIIVLFTASTLTDFFSGLATGEALRASLLVDFLSLLSLLDLIRSAIQTKRLSALLAANQLEDSHAS